MKLATMTGDFNRYLNNDTDKIKELYDAGFRYIDFSNAMNPDSIYLKENWREEIIKVKEFATNLGMKFVQSHAKYGDVFSKDESEREFLMQAIIRNIEICEILGIKNTVVHPGCIVGMNKTEFFKLNKEFYGKLFSVMERCGVNVLCENNMKNVPRNTYYVTEGAEMREFIKYVDHPLFHGCWDVGHANCDGPQYDEILAIGDELYAIHYHDNHNWRDDHLAPFLGRMNHDEIINALIDVGYKGYLTFECCFSLLPSKIWTGNRREFNKEGKKNLLTEPQLFMQRHIEKMLYETGKWMLESYGIFEE